MSQIRQVTVTGALIVTGHDAIAVMTISMSVARR